MAKTFHATDREATVVAFPILAARMYADRGRPREVRSSAPEQTWTGQAERTRTDGHTGGFWTWPTAYA
jgi:hypothetical protein